MSTSSMIEHATNAASDLASLPEELVSNIAARLGSDLFFHFRLTCRALEKKSQHEFGTEYFSSKCIIITKESLQTLVGISNSRKLRPFVHHIYVLTARFPPLDESKTHSAHCSYRRPPRHTEAYNYYVADQKTLSGGSKGKDLLIAAFTNLPKINSLTLVDSLSSVPALVDVLGGRKFTRTTGMSLDAAPAYSSKVDEAYLDWLCYVWKVTMIAVAESDLSTIQHLRTSITEARYGLSPLVDLAFSEKITPKLIHSLRNLQTASLCLRTQNMSKKRRHAQPKDISRAKENLRTFAPALKSVTELSLVVDLNDTHGESGDLCYALISPLALKKLETLRIDGPSFEFKTLGKLLVCLESVKTLFLSHVDLDSSWLRVLDILNKLPKLDHLHLMFLSESMHKAYFLTQTTDPNDEPVDFLGPPPVVNDADPWDDNLWNQDLPLPSDYEPSDSDEDSEEIPDLEDSLNATGNANANSAPSNTAASNGTTNGEKTSCRTSQSQLDFKDPQLPHDPARGYFICLTGSEIHHYLPIFIQEYNVGSQAYSDDPSIAAPGIDMILNSLMGGALGPPHLPVPVAGMGAPFGMTLGGLAPPFGPIPAGAFPAHGGPFGPGGTGGGNAQPGNTAPAPQPSASAPGSGHVGSAGVNAPFGQDGGDGDGWITDSSDEF